MRFGFQVITLLLFCTVVSACNKETKSEEKQPPVSSNSELTKQMNELRGELSVVSARVTALESGDATVSAEEEGYDVAKTKFGPFTVSTRGATPYLDGYKIKLRIGNLTNANFNGAKLNVGWGLPYSQNVNINTWSKSQKTKTFDLTNVIRSGSFTDMEVALTPAKPDEIKQFTVGIELNILALHGR
jgi:hypothetical protein